MVAHGTLKVQTFLKLFASHADMLHYKVEFVLASFLASFNPFSFASVSLFLAIDIWNICDAFVSLGTVSHCPGYGHVYKRL